jgi:hypothetical protein
LKRLLIASAVVLPAAVSQQILAPDIAAAQSPGTNWSGFHFGFSGGGGPAPPPRRTIITRLRRRHRQFPRVRRRPVLRARRGLQVRRVRYSRALLTVDTMSGAPWSALVWVTIGNFNRGCSASERIWPTHQSMAARRPAAYLRTSAGLIPTVIGIDRHAPRHGFRLMRLYQAAR